MVCMESWGGEGKKSINTGERETFFKRQDEELKEKMTNETGREHSMNVTFQRSWTGLGLALWGSVRKGVRFSRCTKLTRPLAEC